MNIISSNMSILCWSMINREPVNVVGSLNGEYASRTGIVNKIEAEDGSGLLYLVSLAGVKKDMFLRMANPNSARML